MEDVDDNPALAWRLLHTTRTPEARDVRWLIRADFRAFAALNGGRQRSRLRRRLDVLTLPGFQTVVIYRVAAYLHRLGLTPLARLVSTAGLVLFSAEVSPHVVAGPGLVLPHPHGLMLGAGAVLGRNVRILRGVVLGTSGRDDPTRDGFPVIGDDCVLCDGVSVFGPIQVGAGSTIGAGVMLSRSVPPASVVVLRQDLVVRTAAGPAAA